MTSSTKNWLIAIHLFHSMSKSKDDQTMKLDQLRKKLKKKLFEVPYIKCGGKTSCRPFWKKS